MMERGQWTEEQERLAGRACFEMARTVANFDLAEAADYARDRRRTGLFRIEGPAAPASYRMAYRLLGFRNAERLAGALRGRAREARGMSRVPFSCLSPGLVHGILLWIAFAVVLAGAVVVFRFVFYRRFPCGTIRGRIRSTIFRERRRRSAEVPVGPDGFAWYWKRRTNTTPSFSKSGSRAQSGTRADGGVNLGWRCAAEP